MDQVKVLILKLEYKRLTKYVCLGMTLSGLGILNFVVSYMYFPALWIKSLSISTILVILGLCIMMITEDKIKYARRRLLQ